MECAKEVRANVVSAFRLRKFLNRIIDKQIKKMPSAYALMGERVEVAVTRLPLGAARYKRFGDNETVRQALLASCGVPVLAGLPFRLDGALVCDGGMTDFQPLPHGASRQETITVSAMYFSRADIRPSQYTPVWWGLFPPGQKELQGLYEMGLRDAFAYFYKAGMVPSATVPCFLRDASASRAECGCMLRVQLRPHCHAHAPLVKQKHDEQDDLDVVDLTAEATGRTEVAKPAPLCLPADALQHTACVEPTKVCLTPSSSCKGAAAPALRTEFSDAQFRYCPSATAAAARGAPRVADYSSSNRMLDRATIAVVWTLRTLCFLAVYAELFLLGVLMFWRAAFLSVFAPRSAFPAWKRCLVLFVSLLSLRLAVRTLPIVGKWMPINTPKLHSLSFFYRVGKHIL